MNGPFRCVRLRLQCESVSIAAPAFGTPNRLVHPHNILLRSFELRTLKSGSEFPEASSLPAYSQVITSLIRTKNLHGSLESEGFRQFLGAIQDALVNGPPADRLLAVSLGCKVANSAKAARSRITTILDSDALSHVLPPLKELGDSDDRYYAASVWRFTERSWMADFLAIGVMQEESAEKARQECVEGLVARAPGLGSVFSILEQRLSDLRLDTESPGDSMARRMRRVLGAVKESLASRHAVSGEDVGPKLRSLLRRAFEVAGPPKKPVVKLELGKEALDLILHIVRSRYALALISETYSPIVAMRDWFTESEWRDLAETDAAQDFAASIQAALELLARSGAVDNTLSSYLVLVAGDRAKARELTEQIVMRNPGLSAEVVAWLTGQAIRKTSPLASESQMVRVEEALADALLASLPAEELAVGVEAELLPQLKLFQSIDSSLLTDLLSHYSGVNSAIRNIAKMRNLEIFGSDLEVEEFSPLKHEFENPSQFGARTIRIVRPGVSVPDSGKLRIIRKALVEAV